MTKRTALQAVLSVLIIVLGNLQAWDSDVPDAGLLVFFLVSLAIALPAVALLLPVPQPYLLAAMGISFLLLIIARLVSAIPLPGLFIILVPAVMGLIFTGLIKQEN